jgi:activator of HSP90 ATPase
MRALFYKLLINFLEPSHGNLFTFIETADFVILAETAVQIATTEKDSTTAFGATDARLFPHMQSSSGHNGEHAATAGTVTASGGGNAFGSFNAASMRANITFGHRNIPFFSKG